MTDAPHPPIKPDKPPRKTGKHKHRHHERVPIGRGSHRAKHSLKAHVDEGKPKI